MRGDGPNERLISFTRAAGNPHSSLASRLEARSVRVPNAQAMPTAMALSRPKFTDAINVTGWFLVRRAHACQFVGLTVPNFAGKLWPRYYTYLARVSGRVQRAVRIVRARVVLRE